MVQYFNYDEITKCRTIEELDAMYKKIQIGFSGIPSASDKFNYYLNFKEAIDWIIAVALALKAEEIQRLATEQRAFLVQEIKKLLS